MNSDLQRAFNFTDEDLAYNKIGEIGPNQLANLKRMRLQLWLWMFLVLPCLLFPLALVGKNHIENILSMPPIVPCFGIFLFFMFAYALFKLQQAIGQGQVTSVTGFLWLHKRGSGRGVKYYIIVENRKFMVTYRQFRAFTFTHGRSYRIYYTPKHKYVVGVEEIT